MLRYFIVSAASLAAAFLQLHPARAATAPDFSKASSRSPAEELSARDTAKWNTEDGRVCHQFQRTFPSGCNEYRLVDDQLSLKRSSGEIATLEAK